MELSFGMCLSKYKLLQHVSKTQAQQCVSMAPATGNTKIGRLIESLGLMSDWENSGSLSQDYIKLKFKIKF